MYNNWSRLLMVLVLGSVVLLTGCSPSPAPVQTQAPALTQESPVPATESPTQPAEAYPAPGAEPTTAGAPSMLYPEPKSGDEVTWPMAYAMIMNGEVTKVIGASSDKFTMTLRDGRSLVSPQPAPGDVSLVIKNCGQPCAAIQVQD